MTDPPSPTTELRAAVKERIMSILTYPVSTEITPCGWAVRPVRQDTVEFLIEEIIGKLGP